jgi:hypothetical protein
MTTLRWTGRGALLVTLLQGVCMTVAGTAPAADGTSLEVGFSRILHGWTNYSTAFSCTHDTDLRGHFFTLAGFYTPTNDVRPMDFAAIVIWDGTAGQTFNVSNLTWEVHLWSGLAAFTNQPEHGDLARWMFPAPTGGSTTVPDAITRGGRPAYEVRFCLTNPPMLLTNGQSCLVGLLARTSTSRFGELYVPTSSHPGDSDVQAGDLIIGGWQYVVDAGGRTIYWGQLATELLVQPRPPPRLDIRWQGGLVELSWPAPATGFALEAAAGLVSEPVWVPVDEPPVESGGRLCVSLPATAEANWFRLRRP